MGGGGGGWGGERQRNYEEHCEQSANLEHQTLFLDFAGFGGASV